MNKQLFEDSDEDNRTVQLSTNKDYAKSYNNFRKKELVKKYKDLGHNVSESSESSSESSDEDDDVVDPSFDQEFFRTLASLKSKDPKIYEKSTRFFQNEANEDVLNTKKKRSKPITLKDYEREVILNRNGNFEDDAEDSQNMRASSPTAAEEESRLKAEFKQLTAVDDSDDDGDFGGIFKKRTKTKNEAEKEEEDFAAWLSGKKDDIDGEAKSQLAPLKNYWSSSKLSKSECFLRDYILNKGYADPTTLQIPTYEEVTAEEKPFSEDEDELDRQAEFEKKYNFRFEEPDAEFIKRYPRTIQNSLRKTDDNRKEKRKQQLERKELEKQEKMKELNILKEVKRREIEEKIRKLKAVTGNDELGFKDEELEEDFDPDAHDRRMQEIFNSEYYNVDEGEEKPECPSDIEELYVEDWDNYNPNHVDNGEIDKDHSLHCEDDDFNMDCDYDPALSRQQLQQELIETTKSRKSRKGRRGRFLEMVQAEKPVFNPDDEKTYGEYIDEYYKLDYEDIIGDVPCRFKYVETTPNDFGLTIEEILLAKNKELNQWASLKKAVQLRPDHIEKKEQRLYKMKAKNEELKRKIFRSLYDEGSDDEIEGSQKETSDPPLKQPVPSTSKSKKRRLRRKTQLVSTGHSLSEKPLSSEPTSKVAVDQPTFQGGSDTQIEKTIKQTEVISDEKPKKKTKTSEGQVNSVVNKNKNATKKATDTVKNVSNGKINPFKRKNGSENQNKWKLKGKSFKGKAPADDSGSVSQITDDRLKAYGINPRKFHNKQKYSKKNV